MADLKDITNTKDHTEEFDPQDAQTNKVYGILAYIGILVLVPIFAAKESKWARFHANQGLVLCIVLVAASLIMGILGSIPYLGWLFYIIGALLEIPAVILMVLGIVGAAKGQAKELPIIGGIRILK